MLLSFTLPDRQILEICSEIGTTSVPFVTDGTSEQTKKIRLPPYRFPQFYRQPSHGTEKEEEED